MSIQSSINQGISVASLLISQNPEVKATAEKRRVNKDLAKKEAVYKEQYKTAANAPIPHVTVADEAAEKVADIAKERFETSPGTKTYEEMLRTRYGDIAGLEEEQDKIGKQRMFERDLAERKKEFNSSLKAAAEARKKATEATEAAQEERRRARAAIYIPESYGAPRERIKYGEE